MVYSQRVIKMKKTIISEEEYTRIQKAAKANKNKRVAKRLEVLELRHAGMSNEEISLRTGFNKLYVTKLMVDYKKQGLDEYIRNKYKGHHRNLTEAEETEILAECEKEAEAGQILTVATIREKLNERLGHETPVNYVYRVLKRHGWRKVMPRPRHPKAASQEEQDSSKKLKSSTRGSQNSSLEKPFE